MLLPGLANAELSLNAPATQVSAGGQQPVIVQTDRTTDITLGAPRTVLNWSSYDLGSDQAVVYRFNDRGWIVLNRVTGAAVVDGLIESVAAGQRGGGNVWFSAPGGVVFGPNARVNVGGLLATGATVATSGFLDPANRSFSFTGGGGARVEVRGGAELTSGGGPIALIAGGVTTAAGAAITGSGGSSVLYAAAGDYTVRFGTQPGDLDLLDFVVPAGGGAVSPTPLSLQGQTVAGSVFLAVVNRADVASAVISAPGLIAAQSASADRGDVVLVAGADLVNRQPGATRSNTTTETTASFGIVSAQRDLLGGFGSPTAVQGQQLAAGRDLGLAAAALDVGSLNAGRLLAVDAGRGITVRSSASAGSGASFRTGGAFVVGGGTGAVTALGRLQLDVGSVQAGQLNSGRSVVVNASGVGANGGPAVNVAAAVAEDDIAFTSTNAAGGIVLGQATLTGRRGDEAPVGRNLILTAAGANADITYGAATGSPLVGATNVAFAGGRDVTVNVSGLLTLGASSAARNFTIRATDLNLGGTVSAANLRIESLQGGLNLGGGAAAAAAAGVAHAPAEDIPPGLTITDAEFQRILVTGEAAFYAGSPNGQARGDLIVQNLNVNPARVPRLLLAAGGANDVVVPGTVIPGIDGGVITIGEAAADSPWRPGRILINGALGFSVGSPDLGYTNVRAFDEVNLNARRDVILGTQRFIALVAGVAPDQIDIGHNQPAGVAPLPDEQNRVFVTAGRMSFGATQRIVQQNTGTAARPNGILLTSQGGVNVTPAGVVDLFGAFRDANGNIRGGGRVQVNGRGGGEIRFNGCDVSDGGCAAVTAVQKAVQAKDLDSLTDADIVSAQAVAGIPPEPPVLSLAEPEPDVIITDPVMLGTGSDELWRKKRDQQRHKR